MLQRLLEALLEDRLVADAVQPQADEHVLRDRHRGERIRLLEHHADPAADRRRPRRPGRRGRRPKCRSEPSRRVPGVSSCIRLSARRKVDLPQPLGPMIAVTFFAGMRIVTSNSAWRAPYQRLKFLMSKATSSAPDGQAGRGGGTGGRHDALAARCSERRGGASGSVDMAVKAGSFAVAGKYADDDIEGEDQSHEDQRAGPGLAVPVVVGRDRVGEDLQGQRRDRLLQVVVPEVVAQGGEEQRRRLARRCGPGRR